MANFPSTYELVDTIVGDLRWVAIIVCGYLVLAWLNTSGDDPDGYS